MRLMFWRKPTVPAPSGECVHLWGNWSAPESIDIRATYMAAMWNPGSESRTEDRSGWVQDRYCVYCNMYQRRIT